MSFEKITTERLRVAEQQEILDGESGLVADLVDAFSAEHIEKGVAVNFGGDRASFDKALKILGLQEAIAQNKLHISDMSVGASGSTSYCSGSLGEWAKGAGDLAKVLDYMQVLRWQSAPPKTSYAPGAVMSSESIVSSSISALHMRGSEDGSRVVDATQPMVTVRAVYCYEPEIYYDNTSEEFNLREFVAKEPEDTARAQRLMDQVNEEFFFEDTTLHLPSGRYSISLGPVSEHTYAFMPLAPVIESRYELKDGRLKEDSNY